MGKGILRQLLKGCRKQNSAEKEMRDKKRTALTGLQIKYTSKESAKYVYFKANLNELW